MSGRVLTPSGLRPMVDNDVTAPTVTVAKSAQRRSWWQLAKTWIAPSPSPSHFQEESAAMTDDLTVAAVDGWTLEECIAKLQEMADRGIAEAKAVLKAAAAKSKRDEAAKRAKDSPAKKAPATPATEDRTAALVYQEMEQEAQRAEPGMDLVHSVNRFLQTPRGKMLQEEYNVLRRQGDRTHAVERAIEKQTPPGTDSPAWRAIERAAEQRIAKSPTGISRAKAIDIVMREDPSLYSEHVAELTPTARPAQAWREIERLAVEKVAKSAKPMTKEKAVDLVLRERPDLYDRHLAERRG